MIGDFLREVAVLTAVFIPLDRIILGEPLTVWSWIAILGVSGGSLASRHHPRTTEKTMSDQFMMSIAPIVSLMVLVGIAGIYFVRNERRESREQAAANKRD